MGKATLTRRTLIGSAATVAALGIPRLASSQKTVTSSSKNAGVTTTDGARFNVIFHGVLVFSIESNGILVYLPKSKKSLFSNPVHQYSINWNTTQSSGDHQLATRPATDPFNWLGLPAMTKPAPDPDENLVLSRGKLDRLTTRRPHTAFLLPYPFLPKAFRSSSVSRKPVFAKLPNGVDNPSKLAFPIVFSYRNPAVDLKLEFVNSQGQKIQVPAYDGGNSVNVHIHADPVTCSCDDHIFINKKAVALNGADLELQYTNLSGMTCSDVEITNPLLGQLGLTPADMNQKCEHSPCKRHKAPTDPDPPMEAKTLPPDSCFGMWVID